ncbi:MAG: hypothetical protein ACLPJY_09815, partial [Rhodomicrobium sp.]
LYGQAVDCCSTNFSAPRWIGNHEKLPNCIAENEALNSKAGGLSREAVRYKKVARFCKGLV